MKRQCENSNQATRELEQLAVVIIHRFCEAIKIGRSKTCRWSSWMQCLWVLRGVVAEVEGLAKV